MTTTSVPSKLPEDFALNIDNLDKFSNSTSPTFTDRLGGVKRTLAGIDAEAVARAAANDDAATAQHNNIQSAADLVLAAAGYAPPVLYAAGINLTLKTQTVEYAGQAYAPILSALPFTTSGAFETAKFRLIQGVAAVDLAAASGAGMVGYDGGTAQDVLDNARPMQNYATLRAYTGRATGVRITALGIAGIFQRDSDVASADNGGTVIVDASGRRWKRLHAGAISVLWFGAVADALYNTGAVWYSDSAKTVLATDNKPAFLAAINARTFGAGFLKSAGKIMIPAGSGGYYLGGELQLKKHVIFEGENPGQAGTGNVSVLYFPLNSSGITVNRYNTLNGGVEGAPTTGADGSEFINLKLVGGGGVDGVGLWMRARAVLRNVQVRGFGSHGVKICATAGGAADEEGNANNWEIHGGSYRSNGGDGLYVVGGDANAGTQDGATDFSSNAGWAINDQSFLGNTYIGSHSATNGLGAYRSTNANARSLFLNCYSEGNQPTSILAAPAMAVGGLHAAGLICPASILSTTYGLLLGFTSFKNSDNSVFTNLGPTGGTTVLEHRQPLTNTWRLKSLPGRLYWDWANISNSEFLSYYDRNYCTPANGYARDLNGWVSAPVGLPLGYLGAGMLARTEGAAIPTTLARLKGDIVWNTNPVAGGFAGWICTAAGTPGTWKTFGAISE